MSSINLPIPRDHATAKSFLDLFKAKELGLGRKTGIRANGDGSIGLTFYETEVVTYLADGSLKLYSGKDAPGNPEPGVMSRTTASRISEVLGQRSKPLCVDAFVMRGNRNVKTFVVRPVDAQDLAGLVPFTDGMTIPAE